MGLIFNLSFGCVCGLDDVSLTSISILSTSKGSKGLLIGTKAFSAFFNLPDPLFGVFSWLRETGSWHHSTRPS